MPRNDLSIVTRNVLIKPGLSLGGCAVFAKYDDGVTLMGAPVVTLTGTPAEVAKVGVSIADIAAGMYAFSGTLAALYSREVTGDGASIEASLFEALAEWVGQPAHFAAGAGRQPGRFGAQHATIAPYGPFESGDGHTILLAIQNEPEWARFCEIVLRRPDVAGDSRFASTTQRVAHRNEVNAIIAQQFSQLAARQLEARLAEARIAFARAYNAVLTDAGLKRYNEATPTHTISQRRHLFDHLDGIDLDALGDALQRITAAAKDRGCTALDGQAVDLVRARSLHPATYSGGNVAMVGKTER